MNIRSKLIIIFLIVSVIPFTALGFFVHKEGEAILRAVIFSQLHDIADSKQKIIEDWFLERFNDTEVMAHSRVMEKYLSDMIHKFRNRYTKKDILAFKYTETPEYERLISHFELIINQRSVFSEIFILDPITGIVIFSTDKRHLGEDESESEYFKTTISQGEVAIKDVYFSERLKEAVMTYSDVIYFNEGMGAVSGVLVADLKVKEILDPLINAPVGMGKTVETVLVNKNNITLLDLKHRPDSALKFKVPPETPAGLASSGKNGITEGIDYRGERVLSAYRHIPDLDWGLVAKIDIEEAYAPIRKFSKIVIIFTILGGVSILLLVSFISKRTTLPLIAMKRIAHEISSGNYQSGKDYDVKRSDEIGDLANAIKGMSEALDREQSEVNKYKKELESKVKELTENSNHLEKIYHDLNETTDYLERIIDHSKDLIITTDTDGRIVEFNREAEEKLGYKREEVINKPASIIWKRPEERKEIIDLLKKEGVVRNREIQIKDKQGNIHDASLTLSLLKNAKGEVIGTVGISKDISEQKMLHYKLLQSEKLAGIGTLASGIAHEINNPLGGILGMAEAILDEDEPSTVKSYANDIVNYTMEASSIVKELSGYSRQVADESISGIDLASLMGNSIKMAKRSVHLSSIEVVTDLKKGCWINANEGEMRQVFVNLAINAIYAMKRKGGRLTLSCSYDDQFVRASVTDTGTGIKKEYLSRIYDPFFTTKPPGKGTGLGLYVVYKIVTKYKGNLEVISIEGEGTTFKTTFPMDSSKQWAVSS